MRRGTTSKSSKDFYLKAKALTVLYVPYSLDSGTLLNPLAPKSSATISLTPPPPFISPLIVTSHALVGLRIRARLESAQLRNTLNRFLVCSRYRS